MDSSELRQLQKHIREALNHLHDPSFLRKSPLAAAWGVSARFDTPATVRSILVSAIEALQPQPEEPPGSRAWEVFQSLYYRYVEQFSQDDVANQMGISLRQLRRLQQAGLEELTYRLSERFSQDDVANPMDSSLRQARRLQQASLKELLFRLSEPPQGQHSLPPTSESAPSAATAEEELDWLKASPPEETSDLSEVLPAAVELLRPLAGKRGVSIETALEDNLPHIVAHPVAVRQALLNVLTVAVLNSSPTAAVAVEAGADSARGEVHIAIDWQTIGPAQPTDCDANRHKLEFAQRLAELSAGRLQMVTEGQASRAILTFSALGQRLVLAIDDNALALQLLQRYAAGTRYRIVGAQSASEALALIRTTSYEVIVIDVMMPHTDGWTILAELRQSPLTAATPIVVCTVLPQRELALSLGADDFIQKPVGRQVFLQALDRQVSARLP